MASIKIPTGCKARPGIEQVLRYPVETRMFEQAVKEYYNLLRMDKELSLRDPNMYKYLVERRELRKQVDPIQDAEGYPDSRLYKLLNESYLKYKMQIQHKAIEEFSFLNDVKEHYIKLTKGPQIAEVHEITDSYSPRRGKMYFSPRSKEIDHSSQKSQDFERPPPSTREVPNSPIRINGVIYYPQPMYQETNSRIFAQSELVNKLQAELKECNKVIDDLRDRLNKTASREIKDGGPSVVYTDKNTPTKLADDFHAVFTTEWTDAFKSLTYYKNNVPSEVADEAISLLMNIIQSGYEFCRYHATQQLQKLSFSVERGLEDPFATILDLRSTQYDQRKRIPESLMREIKNIRRVQNSQTVMKAVQNFKDGDLLRNPQYNYRHSPEMEAFVNSVIEVLWLMCIQDPPMFIKWPRPNDIFKEAIYKPYKKQGSMVKQAVWPAVYLHENGPLIKKGYAKPV